LGSLDPPVSRGAAHLRQDRDVSMLSGARQRPDVLGAGLAQGVVHPVHGDV
jgi:hypothetical protein